MLDDLVDLWARERFSGVYVTHNLREAVRLGHRVVVLSRRPGTVREILEIDLPLDARAAHADTLEAHRSRLWQLLRDEAQAADLELVDG